jgi:DNA polymerase phi
LLAACLLQRYCADEEDETDDSLEVRIRHRFPSTMLSHEQDAVDAVGRMFAPPPKKKGKKARKSEPTEPSDGDVLEPLDMLIDVIIGFLEESTAFLRAVANQVFTLLAVAVERPESLDLILTVRMQFTCFPWAHSDLAQQLARRDPTQDDEAMSVDGEDEEVGDDDGVEANGVSADDGSDDTSLAEEDDEDIEADLELRRKVEEALSAGGMKPAADSDDESEELMDDDQMMAIDEQLAQIFKSQTKKPKGAVLLPTLWNTY